MKEWIQGTMESLGYGGLVFLMFLENVFPPIPSEFIMPLAGFVTVEGKMTFFGVVMAGMIGSVLGALPLYYLGKIVGEARLVAWADRYGHWVAVSGHDIQKARGWFDRHGGMAVFLCRLVPGVRSLISIPAGFAEMALLPFLAYTAVGTAIWAAVLAYAGQKLGAHYDKVDVYMGPASKIILGAIALAAVGWIIYRKRQRERW